MERRTKKAATTNLSKVGSVKNLKTGRKGRETVPQLEPLQTDQQPLLQSKLSKQASVQQTP